MLSAHTLRARVVDRVMFAMSTGKKYYYVGLTQFSTLIFVEKNNLFMLNSTTLLKGQHIRRLIKYFLRSKCKSISPALKRFYTAIGCCDVIYEC